MGYSEKVERVLITLRQIIRGLDSHSRQITQNHGLTVPQIILMREMDHRPGISVGDLAREVSLSQATVTSIIDRLEHRELVTRTRGEKDKRTVHVELTEKGRSVLSSAPPLLHERFVSSFESLKEWEQSQVLSALERIADMMGVEPVVAYPVLTIGPLVPEGDDSGASAG